jgi:hypothetical protein
MIVRHQTLPGLVQALIRFDPASSRIRCRLGGIDPELTDEERQSVRDAALGACRRLARDHAVRDPQIELVEVMP